MAEATNLANCSICGQDGYRCICSKAIVRNSNKPQFSLEQVAKHCLKNWRPEDTGFGLHHLLMAAAEQEQRLDRIETLLRRLLPMDDGK